MRCYICLSAFEKQAVGSLQSCQHVFCLQCLLQWSQTANTCPVDRVSFAFIHQRRCLRGDIQQKIEVRTLKKDDDDDDDDDDEEEGSFAVNCEGCGRCDRRHRLLVCLHCDSGYHMDCLTPSLNTRPEDDWICPECAIGPRQTESSMLAEEISDGELTDLLAEATSTSSRLRPSAVNRPSSSAERHRSTRIQSREVDRSPSHRLQTSLHVPKHLLQASRPAVPTGEAADHSDPSSPSVKLKVRKRRKRAA